MNHNQQKYLEEMEINHQIETGEISVEQLRRDRERKRFVEDQGL